MLTLPPCLGVGNRGAFERSFDFSKFPNLQEVEFGVGWVGGSLLWIPMALSTIRFATSPRLSAIQLSFTRPLTTYRSVGSPVDDAGGDIRRVVDEIARIEREFEGAANFTVHWDPLFRMAFDAL